VLSRVKKLAEEYKQPSSSFREHRWGSTTGLADIDIDDNDNNNDMDADLDTDDAGASANANAGANDDNKQSQTGAVAGQDVCDCVVHRNALLTSGRRTPLSMQASMLTPRSRAALSGDTSASIDGETTTESGATAAALLCGVCGLPEQPLLSSARKGSPTRTDSGVSESAAKATGSRGEKIKGSDADTKDSGVSAGVNSPVMVNFRELLWYWREYYLRRGRDRLSIEFSSHIPFHHWSELVGKTLVDLIASRSHTGYLPCAIYSCYIMLTLCFSAIFADELSRDDGSPTALLATPIPHPCTPYKRPSRTQNSAASEFLQFVP
jgi:hypothetical protein